MSDDATNDIRHFVQAGFLALVAIVEQLREGKHGSPSPADMERAAELLRRADEMIPRHD